MFLRYLPLLIMSVALAACSAGKKGPPTIGEAFAGPATLNIRKELAPKSPVVAVVKHGDKLDVVQTRRRFVRVRTPSGAIGWTDSRQLMSTAQMEDLRKLKEYAAKLPSQGWANVFEALNMHAEPVRASPSFAQIPEKGSVQVVAHRLAPKLAAQTPSVLVVAPKPGAKKSREKKTDSKRTPPPPMPAPPSLPPNWLELSRVAIPASGAEEEFARESTAEAKDKAETREKPPVMEDWTLVRTKDGNAGWVLSRMLQLAIPDEVAQYAEGHRITSYFPLADVQDGDQTKHYWLWTTMSHGGEAYEFDGFRVFVWSLKRHRYETAYIERKVKGYYPVEAKKGSGEKGEGATFSLILDQDGQVFRKTYLFNGYRVTLASKEPYQLAVDPSRTETVASAAPASVPPIPSSGPGLLARLKERIRTVFR